MWSDLIHRVRAVLRRNKVEKEIEQEFQFHLQHQIEKHLKAGMTVQEASMRARVEFGGLDQVKERYRDALGTRWFEDFLRDCRHGVRLLLRTPLFTSVAILSLALGIGANSAIFSLIDRVMLRTLPVKEPERLVEVGAGGLSHPLFEELKGNLTSFTGLFGRNIRPLGSPEIILDGQLEPVTFELVSGSYFSVLGVNAALGQTFTEDADRGRGGNPVAVISYRYWQRRFASDPAVIGRTFRRLNTVFTIIGVTPREFYGAVAGQEPDITVPLTMDAEVRGGQSCLGQFGCWWIAVMGRLKPDRTAEQARAELVAIRGPNISDGKVWLSQLWTVEPASNGFGTLRRRFRDPLTILMGTVALVLLLACANLANLLLARSAVRRREIAVRLAIGARRGRVIRQLLAESLLLALAGGTLGVVLAYGMADRLVVMMSNGGRRLLLDATPDTRILLFAAATSLAACFLFGLAPALQATNRQSFLPALAEIRANRWRMGKGLIVVQMAISFLLLFGAGLFGRTLFNIYSVDTGFDSRGVVLFSTNTATLGYDNERVQAIHGRIISELRALPGIEAATVSKYPPVITGSWRQQLLIDGNPVKGVPNLNSVAADFFKTYRTKIVSGREFDEGDTAMSKRVAVVNEAFAHEYLQDRPPIGRRLSLTVERNSSYEVVGMVKDVKAQSLRNQSPSAVYFLEAQVPPGDSHTFALRTTVGTAGLAPAINAALTRVDGSLRMQDLRTLDEHIARSLLQERMLATLGVAFAGLALLIGAVGIYGVMAYQVARRQREIGIRMALGANASSMVRMILLETVRLTLFGCAIGAAGGFALSRIAEGIVFEIRPNDPVTFGAAITMLLLTALAAAYVPGRIAAHTKPIEALRAD
jgi:predicted permease